MKRRRLGKTGLLVSEIGFGGEWLERHGLQTIGGIELLIHQAMLAFQRWTGAEFDPADMKHELLKTLQNN